MIKWLGIARGLLSAALDVALSENPKGKGRGRTATRGTLLTLCAAILFHVKDVPEELKAVRTEMVAFDRRMALLELRVGAVTPEADNVTDQAVTGPDNVTPTASRSTNEFAFSPK
ncbi:MAG TPA: hypothetical protein VGF13_20655 [Verrucomicrobiae bacterium]|jgi:hypothetical protein